MNELPQRITVKIFAAPGLPWRERRFQEACIRALHRWIQSDAVTVVPIDVHDYSHVHHGPGPMMVGHEAHYRLDREDGEFGLKVAWKRGLGGDWYERLNRIFEEVLRSAALLEQAEGLEDLRFDRHRFRLWIEDRLLAPNTDATWQALAPELKAFAERRFGAAAAWQPIIGGEQAFGAQLEIAPEAA